MYKFNPKNPLHRAIESAGSQAKLARAVGCSRCFVNKWVSKNKVPTEWCKKVEVATGVTRVELRPDIFD